LMRPGHNSVEAHPWVTYHRGAEDLTPVSLDDGSVVQLNANSQVSVRLTDTARQVTLDDGEAYFDVSPSPTKPFDVEAGTILVRAKGTAFTVRKEGDGIETAVERGAIEVGSTDPSHIANAATDSAPSQIKAGEVATIGPSGRLSVARLDPAELADRLAWANPPFIFRGVSLTKAVALFNRYNVRKLEVSGALGETLISGSYRLTEPDKFVESLKTLGIAHASGEYSWFPNESQRASASACASRESTASRCTYDAVLTASSYLPERRFYMDCGSRRSRRK
jgi:ferric-dicitrate binding protein FerR (iron transport regulator)